MTKKSIFSLSLDARSDLIEIRRFTKINWGVKQSQKYINELKTTLQNLAENPAIGIPRSELGNSESGNNVFSFPYVSHVIYYKVIQSRIIIFGVLHKSMIPCKHLQNRNS